MPKLTRALPYILISAALCVFDQLSKTHIKTFLESKPGRQITLIPRFADLVYRHNTGGAFSLFDNFPTFFIVFPSLLMLVMIIMLVKFASDKEINSTIPLSISIMLGGAAGNLIDRVRFGKVFDFVDCYIGKYHWPSFNFADSSIVIGIILFAVFWLKYDNIMSKTNNPSPPATNGKTPPL